ncbi:LEPR-XLL domain-containing protein, partial [Sphaerotilus sp.]|uniref:LEPR-XLL domain-containing protein n=1 Tax=Sphaerotilus sp. TaxID=2093942 RepID=UPI0034E2FA23
MTRIGLETLEQRVLLAGDLPVMDPLTSGGGTATTVAAAPTLATNAGGSGLVAVAAQVPLALQSSGRPDQSVTTQSLVNGRLALAADQTLIGSGTLSGTVVNAGVVAPGNAGSPSPGVVTLSGFEQAGTGVVALEIGGMTPGGSVADPLNGHDQMDIHGRAVLGGTLSLQCMDDFRPVAGQVFDILKWQERTGSFTAYQGLYAGNGLFMKPVYLADRLQLVATPLAGLTGLTLDPDLQMQAVLDRWLSASVNAVAVSGLQINAALDLPGLHFSGSWDLSVAPLAGGGVETRIAAHDAAASWSVGGVTGALDHLTGALTTTGSSTVVDFSAQGRLDLAGGGGLSGQFSVTRSTDTGAVLVSASGVSARLGDASRGASLSWSEGALAMAITPQGYALQASGVGVLQGAPGSSFTGALGVVANTTGQPVNLSFTPAGQSQPVTLVIDSTDQAPHFEARGARLAIDGLGELRGDFAFGTRTVAGTDTVEQDLLVGVRALSADVQLGNAQLALSNGELALMLATTTPADGTGVARSSWALAGQADVRVAVDSALTLTGEQIRLVANPSAQALGLEVPSTGATLLLDVPAQTTRLSGRFTARIDGVISLVGDLTLEVSHTTRVLSNGRTVALLEYALSGSRVGATLSGASGLDAVVAGADMALVYAREEGGTRSWLTTRGAMSSLTVGGYGIDAVGSAQWSLNRAVSADALAEGATLDWSTTRQFSLASGRRFVLDQVGDVFVLPVSGSLQVGDSRIAGQLNFTLDRSGPFWRVDAADVEIVLAAGPALVRLSQGTGQFRLNADRSRSGSLSGFLALDGVDGLTLSGAGAATFGTDGAMTLAGQALVGVRGFGSLSGQVSVARSVSADGERLVIGAGDVSAHIGGTAGAVDLRSANLALVLGTDALGQGGYALVADGRVAASGLAGVTLDAGGRVEINHLGRALDEQITLPNGARVALAFSDERPGAAVVIDQGHLVIGGLGAIDGRLRIESRTDGVGTAAQQRLAIGIDHLSAQVTLGGVGANLSDGHGAVLLQQSAGGLRYAVQIDGATALTGVQGVELSASRMTLAVNHLGVALDTAVATADGWAGLNLLGDEFRLRGQARAVVAGAFSVQGEMFVESRPAQAVTLSDGSQATVDTLLIGGRGLAAQVQAASVGMGLTQVDLAMVVATEQGGAQRRWLGSTALVGGASLSAAGFAMADVQQARFEINRALAPSADASGDTLLPLDAPVIDWSKSARGVQLSDSQALVLDEAAAQFALAANAVLQIGNASIGGEFQISLQRNSDGTRSWVLTASHAQVTLQAGSAQARIVDAAGTLVFGPDGHNSGELTGAGELGGVGALSVTGRLSARFNQDTLELAGALTLGLDGIGTLSGQFAVVKAPGMVSAPESAEVTASVPADGGSAELV